jgi:two-component system, chemotaxis family, response regulator Rcp1
MTLDIEVNILLVEDNRTDAELIAEALKDSQIQHHLELASDGEQAMEYLYREDYKPHLVLLDLNLPKKSGLEVLKEIRRDPFLRPTPVIILTNSRSQDDVVRSYSSFCNAYIRKPLGFEGLLATIRSTGRFWFGTATLPGLTEPMDPKSNPPSSR